jgi:mannose-6-phosphate isomerase-like protein (cupin superfamily)
MKFENVPALAIVDIHQHIDHAKTYANLPLALVNDHVVRVSVMTEPYFWHLHPNSDESFLVMEGSIFIDLDTTTIELLPSQLFTIPKNTPHRTRPGGKRSVNLTFEGQDIETVKLEGRE